MLYFYKIKKIFDNIHNIFSIIYFMIIKYILGGTQMNKILVIGTTSWDTIISVNEFPSKPTTIFASDYKQVLGGTAAGKAINLSKLGFDVTLATKFGNDEAGKNIKNVLSSEKIKFFYIEDKESTEMHTNLMDSHGKRISIYTHVGMVNQDIDLKPFKKAIDDADIILLDICEFVKHLFPLLKDYKNKIWLDIHDYDGKNPWHKEFIPYADAIFMSSDSIHSKIELKSLTKELIKDKKFVVCTHGKLGSEILMNTGEIYSEGILRQYRLVDSNGAGDSFASGFLYGFSKQKPITDCLKYATLVSSLTITSPYLYSSKLNSDWLEQEFENNFNI